MKLEHLLLGLLAQSPATGYDLKKFMDTSGRFLRSRTQMSQVYRTLASMERRGWAEHRVEGRPGATDAKVFTITEAGAIEFMEWLTGPYDPPSRFEDPELSARLEFAGFLSRDQVIALLDQEIEARTREVATFRHRDRGRRLDPSLAYDTDLATHVAEWGHHCGAAAKDAHIGRVTRLRAELLNAAAHDRGESA